MNEHLLKYRITPRVVKSGVISKIEVEGLDESCFFYDDLDYKVEIIAEDNWGYIDGMKLDMNGRNITHEMICTPKNGVISFEYNFRCENLWTVKITRLESDKHIPERYLKYWSYLVEHRVYAPFVFEIYSLDADLYEKRKPYKGDLHIHSYGSDGSESSCMVAAQYRKFGYDFISITDHNFFEPSLEAVNYFKDIDTELKIFPGEEVHPIDKGVLHVVNYNPKFSVNQIVRDNFEAVSHEVEEISRTIDARNPDEAIELAWFKWIYDNIKKAGGIAICTHPYWSRKFAFNVNTKTSDEVLKRGFCDVFEILGGLPNKHNGMQVQLNYEMREKGHKYPIVASSDSHTSLKHGVTKFDEVWTVVFSEDAEKIPDNIMAGMSVAVDNENPENKNVYGDLRLVRYTWFLIENYFETHDSYCVAPGQMILRRVLGDKIQDGVIGELENVVRRFSELFFG